jgi:transcription elongation factor Elf1
MSVYIDRKFLGHVSHKLELFKQKNSDLYNFRCPFCNDSRKNRSKARGYVYRKSNDYFYRCHNCGVSITFANFLKDIDPHSHRQYTLERYSAGASKHAPVKKPDFEELKGNAFARFAEAEKKVALPTISELPPEHYARKYIESRKIPTEYWDEILYAEKFKTFLDEQFPDHGKEDIPDDDRIVLLYKNESGEVTNVAGRALGNTKMRYITVKIKDEKKLFGLQRVQKKDRIYVVEGQFDSFFLPNCVASGDSNLCGAAEHLKAADTVLVFDNEPRNKDIVKQIGKAVDAGYSIVIYPETVEQKDINDMVLAGIDVRALVESNIYTGLSAKLKFITWKKC